jgi:hypothetical protein
MTRCGSRLRQYPRTVNTQSVAHVNMIVASSSRESAVLPQRKTDVSLRRFAASLISV